MKNIVLSQIELTNELDNHKHTYTIDVDNFLKKTIIQDLKILIYAEYDQNKLIPRKSNIKLIDKKILDSKPGETIRIKTSNKVLGEAKVIDEYTINPTIMYIRNKPINKLSEMFCLIKKHDINEYDECTDNHGKKIWHYCQGKNKLKEVFNKYEKESESDIKKRYLSVNGLFKIYYDSIIYASIFSSMNRIEGKASAMASYLSIRDNLNKYLNNKKLCISNPNVFIKDINMEFDALIINKEKQNEYFFNIEDIKAIIEIKSSGYISSKENLIGSQYLDENGNPKQDEFIKYIKEHEVKHKVTLPYIYLSIYESFGQRKTSIHYYEFLLANILSLDSDKYIDMFCGTKTDSDYYLIPYHYDLKEIIDKVLK